MTPQDEMRVMFAFALQPLVAGILAFCLFPIIDYTSRWTDGARPVDAAVSVGFGAALAAVFVVLAVAVPAFVWLRRRGPITHRQTLISGALIGNAPAVLILIGQLMSSAARGEGPRLAMSPHGAPGLVRAIALGTLIGAACAEVFWRMTRRSLR